MSVPTVYVTAPRSAARDIATLLVEERLAACVNVVDCESTYRWDGDVHEDEESVLLAKTTEAACAALMDRVAEVHPHVVPCIERFEEAQVGEPFANWRGDAVEEPETAGR